MPKIIQINIKIVRTGIWQPKPTRNNESQPNKPKTIHLLKSGSYKQTKKPCKFRLIELGTQIQQNIFLEPIRGQCVLILIKFFLSTRCFSLSSPFLNLPCPFLWRQFPYIVPPIYPSLPPIQFLGNPLDACPIKVFIEIIGRAVSWKNTIQMSFLHKCS